MEAKQETQEEQVSDTQKPTTEPQQLSNTVPLISVTLTEESANTASTTTTSHHVRNGSLSADDTIKVTKDMFRQSKDLLQTSWKEQKAQDKLKAHKRSQSNQEISALDKPPVHRRTVSVATETVTPTRGRSNSSAISPVKIVSPKKAASANSTPVAEKKKLSFSLFKTKSAESPAKKNDVGKKNDVSKKIVLESSTGSVLSDSGSLSSSDEHPKSPELTASVLVNRGQDIVKQSTTLFKEVKSSEATQDLIGEGKKIVSSLKEHEDVKQILAEGKRVYDDVKNSEKGQELIKEGKNLITEIKENDKFKQLKDQGKALLDSKNRNSKKFDRQQLVELINNGKDLLKDVEAGHSKGEIEGYISAAQGLLKEVVNDNKDQGKSLISNLKNTNNEELGQLFKEGEDLVKSLKSNPEVGSLITDSKDKVLDLLSSEKNLDASDAKELLSKGKTVIKTVVQSEQGQNIAKHVKSALGKPEVQNMIMKSEKVFGELVSSNKFQKLLQSNMKFISDLKNVVVPFIQDQLLVMKIPPITGVKDTKLGKVDYTLSDVVFSGLTIPPSGVSVEFQEQIIVQVANISAELRQIKWKFRQQPFPHIKDDGLADAKVEGAKGIISFKIAFEDHKPKLTITELDFQLGKLELKVQNASITRLYNWLLTTFSESVQNTVQEKLLTFLKTHIGSLAEKLNTLVLEYWPKVMKNRSSSTGSRGSRGSTKSDSSTEAKEEAQVRKEESVADVSQKDDTSNSSNSSSEEKPESEKVEKIVVVEVDKT